MTDQRYPQIEVLFFRFISALLPCLFFIWHKRDTWALRLPWQVYVLQALGSGISLGCLFISVERLPLAEATILSFSTTLFVCLLSGPLLREKVSPANWWAVIVGFAGILWVAGPTGDFFSAGALFGLASALLQAFLSLSWRWVRGKETPEMLVFILSALISFLCALPLFFYWVTPTVKDFLILSSLGIGGGLGQMLFIRAFYLTSVGILGPITYVSMLWSLAYEVLFFHGSITLSLLGGGVLIVGSGIYIALQKPAENKTAEGAADSN